MADYIDEAADPRTSPERLFFIAYHHPDARPLIARNPNAYADLIEWIASAGDAEVDDGDTWSTLEGESTVIGPSPADNAAQAPAEPEVDAAPGERMRHRRLAAIAIPVAAVLALALGAGGYFLMSALNRAPEGAQAGAGDRAAASQLPSTGPSASAPGEAFAPPAAAPENQSASASPAAQEPRVADLIGTDGVYRDALTSDGYFDESPTWLVLHEAASAGTRLKLELAVRVPDDGFRDIDGTGAAWVGVPPASADVNVQHTTAGGMGYWIVVNRGVLVDGGSDKTFVRITGTFTVREVDTPRLEEFHLTQVSAKIPRFPPGVSDPDRCSSAAAFENTQTAVAQAAQTLATDPGQYQALKAEWIAAPRQWWAVKMMSRGEGGDLVRYACGPWLY